MGLAVGTSGWSYNHWEGVLYPPGLATAKRLATYVERFSTVELNASFYRGPRYTIFGGWRNRLPEGFAMSVKVASFRGGSGWRSNSGTRPGTIRTSTGSWNATAPPIAS
ncbi:hypothetical protein GCM10010523_15550 [Paenarthrobacter ilicis]